MSAEQMSFKAMIKRIANEEQIPAQVVLQNFMFERFFARLSKTAIRENLIVKGGTLISQYLGLSKRSTMDIDLTMLGAKLSEDTITQYLEMVFKVDLDDDLSWELKSIAPIFGPETCSNWRRVRTSVRAPQNPTCAESCEYNELCIKFT